MQHDHAAGVEEVQREIAVARDVHGIARDRGKAQILGDGIPVKRKAAAGERAGTERHDVDAGVGLLHALEIARQHFEISEQIVWPKHRLGAPQMRIAGNHGLRIFLGQREQGTHQLRQLLQNGFRGRAQIQPHIERHLFVAAAPGMDLSGQCAHFRTELANDEGMDIFVAGAAQILGIERFVGDGVKRGDNLIALFGRRECPHARARGQTPASPARRRKSTCYRNAAIPKIVQRPQKVRFQSVRPRVS